MIERNSCTLHSCWREERLHSEIDSLLQGRCVPPSFLTSPRLLNGVCVAALRDTGPPLTTEHSHKFQEMTHFAWANSCRGKCPRAWQCLHAGYWRGIPAPACRLQWIFMNGTYPGMSKPFGMPDIRIGGLALITSRICRQTGSSVSSSISHPCRLLERDPSTRLPAAVDSYERGVSERHAQGLWLAGHPHRVAGA